MTVVADRRSVASGTWSQPEPPPELPSVDDAQRFYLFGTRARSTWFSCQAVPGPVYVESAPGGLARVLEKVAGELTRLGQLRPGWDGRQGRPVTQEAVFGAAWVLGNVLDARSEVPQLFPLPGGGLQIEWYGDDQVEIEIDAVGRAHILATTANGRILTEGTFDPQTPSGLTATIAALIKNLSAQVAAERQRT